MSLSTNYVRQNFLFLTTIFILIVLSQVIFNALLLDQEGAGREISIAGRQRTLVQEIAKLSLEISIRREKQQPIRDELQELKTVVRHFEDSHKALQQGSDIYGISGENSQVVSALFAEVNPIYFDLRDSAREIINGNEEQIPSAIETILQRDDAYQNLMGQVVFQLTQESSSRVKRLRYVSWGLAVLTGIVLYLAFTFFIRPVLRQLRSQNEELLELNQNLEKVGKIKSDFLANMSHEIRTPLHGIQGMADLLSKTTLTPDQKEYVRAIGRSSDNLLHIINDILDYSKIESGKLELEREEYELLPTIEEVIDMLRPLAVERNLELMYFVDPELPAKLIGDATRLKQVLINLVNNAIKFTEKGEVVLEAELVTTEQGFVQLQFSVRDTGIGIEQETINMLFQSFTQADSSTTRKYGGTGLGLAICKRIVKLMGGSIWVESIPGKGSTFYFTIVNESAGSDGVTNDVTGLQGLKAVIVDDNTTNLKILVKQLSNWGIQATPFNSPELVLEVLDNLHKFDLCIVDMQMPEIDGQQLTEKIRERYTETELPIIILSSIGEGVLTDEKKLWNSYLTKPVKPQKLLTTLKKILGLSIVNNPKQLSSYGNESTAMPSAKDLNILIAEDNEVYAAVVERTLQIMGFKSEKVMSGKEVLERVSGGNIDMVLMDLEMPEMGGIETTKKIKTIFGKKSGPVIIALTASTDENERKSCMMAGMDDFLPKPVDPDELQLKISTWFPNLDREQ